MNIYQTHQCPPKRKSVGEVQRPTKLLPNQKVKPRTSMMQFGMVDFGSRQWSQTDWAKNRYVTLRQEMELSCKWWRISCGMHTKQRRHKAKKATLLILKKLIIVYIIKLNYGVNFIGIWSQVIYSWPFYIFGHILIKLGTFGY